MCLLSLRTVFRLRLLSRVPSWDVLRSRWLHPILAAQTLGWSVWMDSNHRPHAYQACALATWATDRFFSQVFQFVHLTVTVALPLTVLLNRSAGFRTFNSTKSSCWSSLDHTASAIFALRCLHRESKIGGDEGIRTLDPLLAGQVLSQLSYTPFYWVCFSGLLIESWQLNNKIYPYNT